MKIQLIRNATLKLEYAGKTLLIDPMFSKKGDIESFGGKERNPIIDLSLSIEDILEGVDAVLVSHTHADHFDPAAIQALPKDIKLYCQAPDIEKMKEAGFSQAEVIEDSIIWEGIQIYRRGGDHGRGAILEHMGKVSGFVLKEASEPSLYIVGDSVWVEEVKTAIQEHAPQVIVTNSGGAIIPNFEDTPILMEESETILLAQASPKSQIVAVHLESLDHCPVSRTSLRKYAEEQGISKSQLFIPEDGESLEFLA